jgi:hypothetical protein
METLIDSVIPETVISFDVYSVERAALVTFVKLKLSGSKSAGGVRVYILNIADLSQSVSSVLFELETAAGDVSFRDILSQLFTDHEVIFVPDSFISKTQAPDVILTDVDALIPETKNDLTYCVLVLASF